MQLNSNTIALSSEDYTKLENLVTKLATENKIENVESIHIAITKDSGIIRFRTAEDPAQPADPNQPAAQDPNTQQPADPNQPAAQDPNAAQTPPAEGQQPPQQPQQPPQQPAANADPKAVVEQLIAAYNSGGDPAVSALMKQQGATDEEIPQALAQIKQVADQAKQQQPAQQ